MAIIKILSVVTLDPKCVAQILQCNMSVERQVHKAISCMPALSILQRTINGLGSADFLRRSGRLTLPARDL